MRLLRAATSPSALSRAFSFSSSFWLALSSFSWVTSRSDSSCCIFFWRSLTFLGLLGPEVGVLGLLLAGVGPVHGIVLLKLHGLHLLLDGIHLVCCSVLILFTDEMRGAVSREN